MKKCYFCGGDIIEKMVSHVHRWGERVIIFEDVPAQVCRQCGETYFAPKTLELIDKYTMKPGKIRKKIEVPVVELA